MVLADSLSAERLLKSLNSLETPQELTEICGAGRTTCSRSRPNRSLQSTPHG
jgi:hypothetical protein